MKEPTNRIGVFIVGSAEEPTLREMVARIDALEWTDPRGWYLAKHALFEEALSRSVEHRIIDGEAAQWEWVDFAVRFRREVGQDLATLSPDTVRAEVGNHIDWLETDELRHAIEHVLAGPAGGLWILTEAAIPPMYADDGTTGGEEDSEPVDVQELTRKLLEFSERSRERTPIERVSLCELDKASIKDAASAPTEDSVGARAKVRARTCIDETDPAVVEAARAVVASAPASRGRGVYDVEGARALLAWLEGSPDTPARSWMLPAVRHAVEAKRGIAIVFELQ